MQNSKGITLVSLVITIIVLLILASIATYSGLNVVNSSKLTAFTAELKVMQTQVNTIYQEDKQEPIGQEITGDIQTQANIVFTESESGITSQEGYRYWNQEQIKELGIEGVGQDFFVNLEKRSVVSYQGLSFEGKTYYTLNQLPNGLYNVEYTEPTTEKPTFKIDGECIGMDKWRITISNIQYNGYIDKWQVKYQLEGQESWYTSEDLSFVVNKDGTYKIQIMNGNVISEEQTKYLGYVKDGLALYYDGIDNTRNGNNPNATAWEDLSGNQNDTIMHNMNTDNGYYEQNGYVFKENASYMEISKGFPINTEQGNTIEVVCNPYVGNPFASQIPIWFGTTEAINGTSVMLIVTNNTYNSPYIGRMNTSYFPPQNNTIVRGNNVSIASTIPVETYRQQTTNQTISPSIYKNGEFLYKTSKISQTASAVQNKKSEIGRSWQHMGENRPFYGKIFAIRVFNRQLTDEEIKMNYQIDKVRFHIK